MRKEISIMIVLVLLFAPWAGRCDQERRPEPEKEARILAASDLQFGSVIILLRSGSMLGGALVGVESDAVILLRKGQEEKIPRKDIRKITIEKESNRSRAVLPIMLLGLYLGNVFFFRADGEPPFYLENEWSAPGIFLWESIIIGGSTGLGFLLSGFFERKEKVFEFGDSEKENLENWEGLKRFILGKEDQRKIHLSLQGGQVFPRISSRYKSFFRDAGYSSYVEEPSRFNMLRKIQLVYSAKPYLDIGLAISWLGEPTSSGYKETSYQAYNPYGGYQYTAYEYRQFIQKVSSTGYFAVGVYRPFFNQAPKNISWNMGFGVGTVETKFSLQSYVGYPFYITEDLTISKLQFGALAFTELNFNLTEGLSLGLAADYTFAPPIQAAALPETGVPAQRHRGVNGSIGFSLGLHF